MEQVSDRIRFLNLIVQTIYLSNIQKFAQGWLRQTCRDFRIIFFDKNLSEQQRAALEQICSLAKLLNREDLICVIQSNKKVPRAKTAEFIDTNNLPRDKFEVQEKKDKFLAELRQREEDHRRMFSYQDGAKLDINWDIFDHIYCLHFKPYNNRFIDISKALGGVGILNKRQFSFWYSYPSEEYDRLYEQWLAEEKIFDFEKSHVPGDFGSSRIFNLAMNSYNLLKEAYANQYRRILICEDDIVFLKDKKLLKEYIDHFPLELDIVNMDYWMINLDDGKTYQEVIQNHKINSYFSETTGVAEIVNASFISLTRRGIKHCLDNLEQSFKVADYYQSWHPTISSEDNIRYGISNINLAVQYVVENSNNCQSFHANQWRYNKSHGLDLYQYDTYEKKIVKDNIDHLDLSIPDIKTALVCIAKDEENYIEEWIEYHLHIGFDKIHICGHQWNYQVPEKWKDQVIFERLEMLEYNQLKVYTNFKDKHLDEYDWVMFLDVDEFLNLKHKKYEHNVKKFINMYIDNDFIALNWKMFGSLDVKSVQNNNYSSILRFTKCRSYLDRDKRILYNFSKIKNDKNASRLKIGVGWHNDDQIHLRGFDFTKCIEEELDLAYINHYQVRSKEEYLLKHIKNLSIANKIADKVSLLPFEQSYIERNRGCNEDVDTSLRDYWIANCQNLQKDT